MGKVVITTTSSTVDINNIVADNRGSFSRQRKGDDFLILSKTYGITFKGKYTDYVANNQVFSTPEALDTWLTNNIFADQTDDGGGGTGQTPVDVTVKNTGTNPKGQTVTIPIGGQVANSPWVEPLDADEEFTTQWINTTGYAALLYVIRTDVPSALAGIRIDYSDDGETAIAGGNGVDYSDRELNMQIQRVLVPKATFTRIRYRNGSDAQSYFRLEVKLSTSLVQPTEGSLNVRMTGSALAMYTKTDIELTDDTGRYDQIKRTDSSLNVHVDNFPEPPEGNATAANQTNGNQRTVIVDGNNQIRGTIANPFKVDVTGDTVQPIKADSLPLPAGAAKDTTLQQIADRLSAKLGAEVSGTVNVGNFPASQAITGAVTIGNFPATQPISGNVGVNGSVEIANDAGNPIPVSVGNFPATQQVSGTVGVNGSVEIANDAGNPLPVTVGNFPATQAVSGSVTISNFPASTEISNDVGNPIPVSGNVGIIGTVPLPSGAATAALQTTGNTALGAVGDAAVTDPTASGSIISLLKGLLLESIAAGSSGTLTSISLAANVAQTIPASANRKQLIISSTSGTILIAVGFTATANNWSYRIVTNGTVEINEKAAPLAISLFATAASTVNVTQII